MLENRKSVLWYVVPGLSELLQRKAVKQRMGRGRARVRLAVTERERQSERDTRRREMDGEIDRNETYEKAWNR